MSEQPSSTPPAAPAPGQGAPIPLKVREDAAAAVAARDTSPPTSYKDCQRIGGHGGAKGDRVYYPNPYFDPKTGEPIKGPRVCEICGEVDI